MARSSIERRAASRSRQDLRRDLREADEQRFHLEAALNAAANGWLHACEAPHAERAERSGRSFAHLAALITVTGLCVSGGFAWQHLQRPNDIGAPAAAPPASIPPLPAPSAAEPVMLVSPRSEPVALRPAAHSEPATHFQPAAHSQPAASSRSRTQATTSRPHSTKVKSRSRIDRRALVHRARPRPLSPAEFGRRAVPAS
jgi:hypothetical protein